MTEEQFNNAKDLDYDIQKLNTEIHFLEKVAEHLCQHTKEVKIEFTYYPDHMGYGKIETDTLKGDAIDGKENSLVVMYLSKIDALKAKRDELQKEFDEI